MISYEYGRTTWYELLAVSHVTCLWLTSVLPATPSSQDFFIRSLAPPLACALRPPPCRPPLYRTHHRGCLCGCSLPDKRLQSFRKDVREDYKRWILCSSEAASY